MLEKKLTEENNELPLMKGSSSSLWTSGNVFNRVFVDFGDNFVVTDRDRGECKEVRIESATFDGNHLTCKCFSGKRHDLESVDVIHLRSCPDTVHIITVMNPFEFAIDCEVPLPSIPPGDTAVQAKIPQTFHHK